MTTLVLHAGRDWLRRQSSASWAFADQALVSGVNFLTAILLARALGPDQYGVFTLAWMILQFFSSIHFALTSFPMLSLAPRQSPTDRSSYFGAVFVHQLTLAACCAVMTVGVAIGSEYLIPSWKLAALTLPLATATLAFQVQDFIRRYFFACSRASAAFGNDAVAYLAQLFLLLGLLHVGLLDSTTSLWVIAGSSGLAIIAGLFAMGRLTWRPETEREVRAKHWEFSKWFAASAVMQWTSGSLFIVAAATRISPAAAGTLRAAQNIIGITHVIFLGMENFVPLHATRAVIASGPRGLFRYLARVTLMGSAAIIPIAVAVALWPGFWLNLIYEGQYQGYEYVLQWYAVIYIFVFLGIPLRAGLRALERTSPLFHGYVALTIFSVALSVPVVDRYGLSGAVAGLLATQILLQAILAAALIRHAHSSAS